MRVEPAYSVSALQESSVTLALMPGEELSVTASAVVALSPHVNPPPQRGLGLGRRKKSNGAERTTLAALAPSRVVLAAPPGATLLSLTPGSFGLQFPAASWIAAWSVEIMPVDPPRHWLSRRLPTHWVAVGDGIVMLACFGLPHAIELSEGEELRVKVESIIAFTATARISPPLKVWKGLPSAPHALPPMAEIVGPGTVWLQSGPPPPLPAPRHRREPSE